MTIAEAAAEWHEAQDGGSAETAIVAVGRIVAAVGHYRGEAATAVILVASRLLLLYATEGTDPDGESTLQMYEALSAIGWSP